MFVGNLFGKNENLKSWVKIKDEFVFIRLIEWIQLKTALDTSWKKSIK